MYRKPPSRHRPRRRRKPIPQRIRPGADRRLRRIFAKIGIPEKRPFTPDPFQVHAVDIVGRSDCLVTAPTGSGKTWIALQAIGNILAQGGRSWYASPLKALSNTKYAEFAEYFGKSSVGILTGDRKEHPDAPIIVGTTEILRNQLYDAMYHGVDLDTDFVVLDEAHYLGDTDRGVVWEEIMIYLPERIPLLLLSATIGNASQIAGWLESIRQRHCRVVEETHRSVPLYSLFLHPSGTLFPLTVQEGSRTKRRLYKKVRAYLNSRRPLQFSAPHRLPPFGDILRVLARYDLLPAIFFLKSRADCDRALELCRGHTFRDDNRKDRLRQRIDDLLSLSPHIGRHRQRWHLEHLGVASHHSGQLPAWKLVLENLMTEGLLDAVFATSTVAAGVNFPARTVLFLNSDRFNGREFLPLTPTEYHQMTGRAGRRGMDRIGFAVAIPGRFMDIPYVGRLNGMPPSDVVSQIRVNFSMVLNLLLSHTPEQIEELLEKSFAAYLKRHPKRRQRRHSDNRDMLWESFLDHLAFLKETGFVGDDDRLTEDGIWASQLRMDQPLMVAEGFRRNVFPDRDPVLLAAIIGAFVNERELDDRIEKKEIPKRLQTAFLKVKRELRSFARLMADRGFDVRPLYLRPALTVYAWAAGDPWEHVVRISEMEEGNLAMLILRTVDNLRHVRGLVRVFPAAAAAAEEGIELVLRDPVLPEG
ncbi:ATP-dependent DNA helicase [Olavius algarvensis associated proteobacterium Delta 3]|nr:ATP-dependent DNA helicase [Olavius algarvensis associated proteobacterium Delta 3]